MWYLTVDKVRTRFQKETTKYRRCLALSDLDITAHAQNSSRWCVIPKFTPHPPWSKEARLRQRRLLRDVYILDPERFPIQTIRIDVTKMVQE
jgi:hypothetical protein